MKKVLLMALLAAAFVPAVHAAQGGYVGLTAGAGKADLTLSDATTSIKSTNSPVPLNGYAGYAFNETFAIEAGITYFGEYRFDAPPTALFGMFHAAVKGSMPLNEKWLLTGKVGVARHRVHVELPDGGNAYTFRFESTRPLLGIGMEYRFGERLSATLELIDYGTGDKPEARIKVRNLEAGIKYRF